MKKPINITIAKMAEAAHNVRMCFCEALGCKSFKPMGFEELLRPFAELSDHTKECEVGMMKAAINRLKEDGFVIVTRGFVIWWGVLLGLDLGLTIFILRLFL